jgi:hypothetical protein
MTGVCAGGLRSSRRLIVAILQGLINYFLVEDP